MSEVLEVETVTTTARPGRRLAEAREAQGLALEDVAGQLRLSLHILRALERDDYDQLPPAAFVTGYLRGYARLLGLPEQEILDGYPGAEKIPPVGVVACSQPPQVRASDPRVRAVTYLVFGGLILLSALWWASQEEPEVSAPAAEAVVAAAEAQAEPSPAPAEAPATADQAAPASGEAAAAASAAPAVTKPAPVPVMPVIRPILPAPTPAPAPAVPAEPEPEPAAAEPEAPPPPPLTADMPQSKLELTFSGDCWAEVTDAAGRLLAYDLFQAGRTLVLRGEAPFKVFFGYSPAAQVSLNGEVFDHTPYQRRNDTARFRVGSTDDNAARTD
ncbi:MAG: helix-turn-helix domain-containing protein [Thiohalomonadaceae bacterium]